MPFPTKRYLEDIAGRDPLAGQLRELAAAVEAGFTLTAGDRKKIQKLAAEAAKDRKSPTYGTR